MKKTVSVFFQLFPSLMMQSLSTTGCQAHFGITFIGSEMQHFSSRNSELGIITVTLAHIYVLTFGKLVLLQNVLLKLLTTN